MSSRSRAAILVVCCALAACDDGVPPDSFAGREPPLACDRFFEGHLESWGVFETRAGAPTGVVTTRIDGRRDGDRVAMDQSLVFPDGRRQDRAFVIRRLDDHHYQATSAEIVGIATAEGYGNACRWAYELRLEPGARFRTVWLEQWMYLLPDQTLLNRTRISKFGVTLASVTESFRHVDGPVEGRTP